MKNWTLIAKILTGLSVLSVILAVVGAFAQDIWLAPTQWLLVAAVSGIWGVWTKLKK